MEKTRFGRTRPVRLLARWMPNYTITLAFICLATLGWMPRVQAGSIVDTFNGPTDSGWLHYTPLELVGTPYSFGVTNGVYSLGVGPSSVSAIAPSLIAAGRVGLNWQDFDVRIEFSGWDVGSATNTAVFLIARQSGETNNPPYGPFAGYTLTIQPSTTPELADAGGAQARLVLSILEGTTLTPIATAQMHDLKATEWYEARFLGQGSTLLGRVSASSDPDVPIAEVRGSDSTYASGFFSIGVLDQAGRAGIANNGARARFRNLRATSGPQDADFESPPPVAVYKLVDRFPKPNDAGWTHFNPFASFGVFNGFNVTTNGIYYLTAAPSPIPRNLPATVAALRTEADWSDFQSTVDFTGWVAAAKTNGYILSIARAHTNKDNTLDFYGLRVVPTANPDIPGTVPYPFLIIDRWEHGVRTRTNSQANLQAISFLSPSQTYRLVFTGRGDLLTGRLYELSDTNRPLAQTSLVDSTLGRGLVGLMAIDRFALNNAGNSGVRVGFANFAAGGTTVSLSITRDGIVQWPAMFTGWTLQQTTNPIGFWVNSPALVRTNGANFVVSPGTSAGHMFYRLFTP